MNAPLTAGAALSFPFATPPSAETATEIAPRIHWVRIPLGSPPGHVNAYVLDDGDSWTVVDSGLDTPTIRDQWAKLLDTVFAAKPVARIVITHHHPDHIGLAGWFTARGAELITTRTAYLLARMMILEGNEEQAPETLAYWRRGGLSEALIAERRALKRRNMADLCAPLPPSYTRIVEGQIFRMGGRDWAVRMGNGHAPEHATFWTDEVVIGGDQLLPGISPNLGAWLTEPDADPVGEWIESCERLSRFATAEQLILPGHKLPYRGLPHRLANLEQNHRSALKRLAESLTTPKTAADCFPVLFSRTIGPNEMGLALAEAIGHLNHLQQTGRATRQMSPEGTWLWQAVQA